MNKESKTILLTGATGLVGSRLLPRLMADGWDCRVLVRENKGIPAPANVVIGDLFDNESLAAAVKDAFAIIHLAAVFRTQDNDLIWKTNLEGTRCLINAVQLHAPNAKFILASTSNVYNNNNTHPALEDDELDPKQAYPASKVAAENLLKGSGLEWAILRFPFVYGEADNHLQMLPKHAMSANWHPAMKMSTIHHRDIGTAMNMALDGVMDFRTVNIADEAPLSVYELSRIVGTTLNSSNEPLQNPWQLHADTLLARSLGFKPVVRTVYQAQQENIL